MNLSFNSKIMKIQMNYNYLYAASKDYIFVFALSDMQLISRVKAPNHLLRIIMNPNLPISQGDHSKNGNIVLAYTGSMEQALIQVVDVFKMDTQSKSTYENSHSSNQSGLGQSIDGISLDKNFPISKMVFSPNGELIAACTSHNNLLTILRVSDGEKVSTLQPSMSSKGDSSILDFSFLLPSFLCILAKVTSKV